MEAAETAKSSGRDELFFSSEACERAMLGGKTMAERRLGEDWMDPERRLAPVINPDPNAPDSPADLQEASDCGLDFATRVDPCESVADCPEDMTCGCPGASNMGELQAHLQSVVEQWYTSLCQTEMFCGSDTECTCGPAPTSAPGSGRPPVPPVDSPLTETIFFGNQGASLYFDLEADPASAIAVGMLVTEERQPRGEP